MNSTNIKSFINHIITFNNTTQRLINNTFTKNLKDEKVKIELRLKDEEDPNQELPTGKEKVKNDSENEHSDNEDSLDEEQIQTHISFTKDVLPYVIPLTCILTAKNSNMDFVHMLNDIKENPELLDTFNDQCLIWWNKKDLIELIKDIVNRYFDKNSNTYNISVQFKMSLQSLIDNPKELLQLINDCLKPKEIEKKQFGEVFTPMELVNKMLDKLPIEVWTNKNLKWLDPCCGMGNFQIEVYLRLYEGLKDEIEDIKERKKHILENMLYMCELNKKNVLICRQIFDINNEFELNIYEGDSLIVDTNKEFNIKQFDIIMGNPPYNKNNIGTGNTIWHLFVEMSLELLLKQDGYLVFVHPSLWRKPQSEKTRMKKYFKLMTYYNQMLYLEIHNTNDGLQTFGCGTRYDFYIIHKKPIYKNTILVDENNIKYDINLEFYNWLPNSNYNIINLMLAKENEEKLIIINDFNYSRLNKLLVSAKKDDIFKYELIYLTPKSGIRYMYSKLNNKGHFGVKKIIIGETGIDNAINDYEGKYGMTQDSFAILIDSKEEGDNILKVLISQEFKKILKESCSWSNFRIDWRLFLNFKKTFYKIFKDNMIDDELNIISNKTEKYNIIKYKRKNYYLIEDNVYIINKNKSKGDLIGNYVNEKVIEVKKSSKVVNDELVIEVKKKKSLKVVNDELGNEPIIEVKKKSIIKKS